MKNIPNIISVLRILASAILFFTIPYSLIFWLLYSTCGASDIADGFIARKTNCTSRLGSTLDSIADIVFIFASMAVLVPTLSIPVGILIWIIFIAFIKTMSLVAGYFKYHAFAYLHTYLNKATGFILFCFPYLYSLINAAPAACLICAVATISAAEELLIIITSKELSANIKGIFKKQK